MILGVLLTRGGELLRVLCLFVLLTLAVFARPIKCLAGDHPVLINEIYPNPATGEIEWIELLNLSSENLVLDGYTIEDNTGHPKGLSGKVIKKNGLLVLEKGSDFSFSLNNNGDRVILKNNGSLTEAVTYGDFDDGNSIDNAPKAGKGKSISRKLDRFEGLAANNFVVTTPTKVAPNIPKRYSNNIQITKVSPTAFEGNDEYIQITNIDPLPSASLYKINIAFL